MGLDKNTVAAITGAVNASLAAEFIEPTENARLWNFAFSAEDRVSITYGKTTVEAKAIFTGGDFFFFHPLEMLSGSFYGREDINSDAVVLDRQLAWKLSGGVELKGTQIYIGSVRCFVSGVSEIPDSKAYGDECVIYLPYSLLERLGKQINVTCYEAVLPNPIEGFGGKIFAFALSSYEGSCVIVENTGRFGIPRLYGVLRDMRSRFWRTDTVTFPFWENEARANESIAALLLAAAAAAAVFPVLLTLYYIGKLNKYIRKKITDTIKKRRSH